LQFSFFLRCFPDIQGLKQSIDPVAARSFIPSARRLLTKPYNKQYFYIALNGDRGLVRRVTFEWDDEKDRENQKKHSVSFAVAQRAFLDPKRVIAQDVKHSSGVTV
jgi:hypothetical protein